MQTLQSASPANTEEDYDPLGRELHECAPDELPNAIQELDIDIPDDYDSCDE
jgi:hypothetical protein